MIRVLGTGERAGREEDSLPSLPSEGHVTARTGYCSRCGRTKARDEFWPNPNVSTGLSSWCKDCQRAATRASRNEYRDRYNAKRRKAKEIRVCAEPDCQETLEAAGDSNKRFHSKRCKRRADNRAYRQRRQAQESA